MQAPGLVIDQTWPGKEPGKTPPEQLAAIMGDATGYSLPESGHSVRLLGAHDQGHRCCPSVGVE